MAARVRGVACGRLAGLILASVSLLALGFGPAQAQATPRAVPKQAGAAPDAVALSIPDGPLEPALVRFTEQAKLKLVYGTDLTQALTTPGLEGTFPPLEALGRLLDGTGLSYRRVSPSTLTLVNPRYAQLGGRPEETVRLDEIVVEGRPATARAAGLPPPTGTVGQPPPPFAGGQVATGTRVGFLGNRSVLTTPFNVTGFTEKLIADQQARTLADVVLNDPSVRNDAPPFSERDSFFIRGFSVTSLDVAFDGLFYLANPRRTLTEGLERVEILKGPSALISGGTGRVGGTINLIPKRAYDEPLTRLTTTYLSDSQVWTHADLGRRFGPNGEWGARTNLSYRNGNTALDKNAIEVGVATLGLDYRGERLRASLDLVHNSQNITAPTSLFNAVAPGIAVPRAPNPRLNTASSLEYIDSRYNMAAGRVEYDILPDTTLYAAGGVSRYNEDFLTSSYRVTSVTGQATNTLAIQPQEITGMTGEVGLRAKFQTGFIGHQLSVAAVEANNRGYRGGFLVPTLPVFQTNIYDPVHLPRGSVNTLFLPRSDGGRPLFQELSVRSVGIADTLSLGDDRFLLTLGGRFQQIDQQGYNTRPGTGFGTLTSTYDQQPLVLRQLHRGARSRAVAAGHRRQRQRDLRSRRQPAAGIRCQVRFRHDRGHRLAVRDHAAQQLHGCGYQPVLGERPAAQPRPRTDGVRRAAAGGAPRRRRHLHRRAPRQHRRAPVRRKPRPRRAGRGVQPLRRGRPAAVARPRPDADRPRHLHERPVLQPGQYAERARLDPLRCRPALHLQGRDGQAGDDPGGGRERVRQRLLGLGRPRLPGGGRAPHGRRLGDDGFLRNTWGLPSREKGAGLRSPVRLCRSTLRLFHLKYRQIRLFFSPRAILNLPGTAASRGEGSGVVPDEPRWCLLHHPHLELLPARGERSAIFEWGGARTETREDASPHRRGDPAPCPDTRAVVEVRADRRQPSTATAAAAT
jgi:iron complex outermembrane receptor protein